MSDQAAAPAGQFDALDESGVSRFQWKIMFVSGMGFFTDASRATTQSSAGIRRCLARADRGCSGAGGGGDGGLGFLGGASGRGESRRLVDLPSQVEHWQVPFLSNPAAYDRAELERTYQEFLIKTVSEIAPSPAVPVETLVAEGDPTESLIEASKHAQLLVLGSRGRSPFAGLMLGSVSQACAAHAACPVVVVKRTDEDI
jgi:nucleotide-binding universal stress UspA family protein